MTSSDETALDDGAIGRVAERVGSSLVGRAGATPARVAVVCAKFNGGITERLLEGALHALATCGVDAESVTVAWVPGAFELPLAAQRVIASRPVDAVVALGAVIRGDTPHFDFVAGECASGLQRVALDTGVPVVFGVLTTSTVAQALERCAPGESNKGYEAALTALEMVDLLGPAPSTGPTGFSSRTSTER
jgi:6,7-dimethyl-8-ribityllumazine synthase